MQQLRAKLDAAGVRYEPVPHEATDLGAATAARIVLLSTHRGLVQAIVPTSRRVDIQKAREVLGTRYVEVAGARAGGRYLDRVLVDGRVCDRATAVIEGDPGEDSLRVRTRDLAGLTGASLVDLCHDAGPAAAFRH